MLSKKTIAKHIKYNMAMLILVMVFSVFLPQNALAHSPSEIMLEYDLTDQKLMVTITHSVVSPDDHYIETVEISVNDVTYLTQDYTSQPTTSTFTYSYDVEAVDGDIIEVTASCNIVGSITDQITAEAPPTDEILLVVSPEIDFIHENTAENFSISSYYSGEPFDVTLKIDVLYGAVLNYQRLSEGQYKFMYMAPDVNKDLIETLNIEASKEGYNDAEAILQFTIENIEEDGTTCPTLDGKIDEDEYDFLADFSEGDFKLYWKVIDDTILIGIVAKTSGWVSLGIEPSDKMKNADMIIGWVADNGDVTVYDCYSTDVYGPHPRDTQLGGNSDILCYGGKEAGGTTTIEFKRLLNTGDSFDKNIPSKGDVDVIWAFGPNDEFDSQHTKRGYATLDIASGEYSETQIPSLWIFHAILMTVGFVLMAKGVIIAKLFKKKNWWFKIHKTLGLLAAIFSVTGLLLAIYMISESSGEHLRVPHAYLGVITLFFVIMTPILCYAQSKAKNSSAKIRSAHRWFGRIAFTLVLINIISGLLIVGIL